MNQYCNPEAKGFTHLYIQEVIVTVYVLLD